MKPSLERVALAPGLEICRITTGLQMADQKRHGRTVDLDALADLLIDYAETGFDSFDMADHYGGRSRGRGLDLISPSAGAQPRRFPRER